MKMAELNLPFIGHGGDYNPDQWRDRPDILAEDIRLMKLVRCNPMSVGIFAWATLEHFQRTRGVLRLMAAVIHELWMANDASASRASSARRRNDSSNTRHCQKQLKVA